MDHDPLLNPEYREPGFLEKLREAVFGLTRPLDCAQIEITSFCSGSCFYCPHTTQASQWKSRHMEAETFTRLWPLLRNSQRAHLQGWGEPLLHPRFFDFAAFARKAGCLVSTTSSGLRMNEVIAERIAASQMDIIAFSLAGTDQESNSARKGIAFDKVCSSIKILRKKINLSGQEQRPEIHLAYLMLADRMEAASRLPQLMDELDVEMAVVSTLDYLAMPEHKDLAFSPTETEKIACAGDILEKAAREAEKSGRIIHFALPDKETGSKAGGCRENIGGSIYINADGQISPCVYLNVPDKKQDGKRVIFGDALAKNAWQIWLDKDYAAFRKKLLSGDTPEACMRCPKRHEKAF